MAYGLPSIGESSWGQKILDSFAALKSTADAAQPAASLESAVASKVGTAGALDSALSATILDTGTPKFSPWGNRLVLLGNSRFDLEKTPSTASAGNGFQQRGAFFWASLHLQKRFDLLGIKGVSGDTLTGMISRWPTQVAPFAPDIVAIRDAVNDISASATYADLVDRYTQLIELNRSIGAKTILLTTTPRDGNDTAKNTILSQINRWVVNHPDADVLGIDVTSAVVNDSALTYRSGAATDGLHQSRNGAALEGLAIARALDPLLPPRFALPLSVEPGVNLLNNPMMAGTPGHSVASNYDVFPAQDASGMSYDLVARTDGVPGNWQKVTAASSATASFVAQTRSISGFASVGEYARAVVEMKSDAWSAAANAGVQVYLQALNASNTVLAATYDGYLFTGSQVGDSGDASAYPLTAQPGVTAPTLFETREMNIPSGTTQLKVLMRAEVTGVVYWGRAAIYKVAAPVA